VSSEEQNRLQQLRRRVAKLGEEGHRIRKAGERYILAENERNAIVRLHSGGPIELTLDEIETLLGKIDAVEGR
jgi:hypothetical protein